MLKVALICRSTMYSVIGGDTIQVLKTAEELNKLGMKADVFKASDSINYDNYDLLHFFNIIRPSDHLYHIRKSNKPFVISTIYLEYSGFDRRGRGIRHRLLFGLFRDSKAEYVKNLFRFYKRQDKMVSTEYLWGHRRAIKSLLEKASAILPNSVSEGQRISRDFGYHGPIHTIPNGVDLKIFKTIPKDITRENKVISVAQVFGMKNQLGVIRACKHLNVRLDIVGSPPPNHQKYYQRCRKIAGNNVRFVDFLPQEKLIGYYASSKVHALPSWFETTGLSSLEAAAMGCNLVVSSHGDTKDYFEGHAWFCQPDDQKSINTAIENAMSSPVDESLRDIVLQKYTWKNAAQATKAAYENVLGNPNASQKV